MITEFGLGFTITIPKDIFEIDELLRIAPYVNITNTG
jgi:hypothetical protein